MYGRAYYLVRRKWPAMYSIYPHKISALRDVLKGVHVLAGALYQPLMAARHLPDWQSRVLGLPLLFAAGIMWRLGMLVQKLDTTNTPHHLQGQ